VFEHADADDLVEHGIARQVAVIDQLDADPILQALRGDPLPAVLVLVAAQRDAVGGDAVLPRRPEDECAPAAADVQQPLAGG
jgi:hypothetical protein